MLTIVSIVMMWTLLAGGQQVQDGSTWIEQISQNLVSVFHYGHQVVKVYEQPRKPKVTDKEVSPWYFFFPVNALLPHSANCVLNRATRRHELRFAVELWNEQLRSSIVDHLRDSEGIDNAKVAVVPFEQVSLASGSDIYRPTTKWLPFQKLMAFRLAVGSRRECDQLRDHMRTDPQDFLHFRLLFNMAAATSQSRTALIEADAVRQGPLFRKLSEKSRDSQSVLLTGEDTNRLLYESLAQVMADAFDDAEKPSPSAESKIYDTLKAVLVEALLTVDERNSHLWASVHYEPENWRPDLMAQSINDIYQRSDQEAHNISALFADSASTNLDLALQLTKYRLIKRGNEWALSYREPPADPNSRDPAREEIRSLLTDGNAGFSDDQLAETLVRPSTSSGADRIEMLEVFRLILEAKRHLQWQGGRFEPKPVIVNRINLSKNWRSRDIRVTYSKATLAAGIVISFNESTTVIDMLTDLQTEHEDTLKLMDSRLQTFDIQTRKQMANIENAVKDMEAHLIATDWQQEEVKSRNEELHSQAQSALTDISEKLRELSSTQSKQDSLTEMMALVKGLQEKSDKVERRFDKMMWKLNLSDSECDLAFDEIARCLKADVSHPFKKFAITGSFPVSECPGDIGSTSKCAQIDGMGCYCVVEEARSLPDAAEYCALNGMKLVAIETREEQHLVSAFLSSNLGARDKYQGNGFWTSGSNENHQYWRWTSSERPLHFRNWELFDDTSDRIFISGHEPFQWLGGLGDSSDATNFICEASAPLQEVAHLTAAIRSEACPETIGTNSTCTYIDPIGCYCVVLTLETWNGANRHCASQGMQLVSFETEYEHRQIVAWLREHNSKIRLALWTSGIYHDETSRWMWAAIRRPLNDTHWDNELRDEREDGQVLALSSRDPFTLTAASGSVNTTLPVAHHICEARTESADRKAESCTAGDDWTCHGEVTGCYCYQTIAVNWTSAVALCETIGMKLVSVDSAAKQMILASALHQNGSADWWTCGAQDDDQGSWLWTATDRPMTYTNWARDEPTKLDTSEHAVKMFSTSVFAKWAVWPKTKEFLPLCEK